jgi:nitric oxide reductase large subunit
MNSIDIIFLIINYSIYIFIGSWVYRNYIFPYLLQERQNDLMQKAQLKQRLLTMQQTLQHFTTQIDYITAVFQKILHQNKDAEVVHQKIALEKREYLALMQIKFQEQQEHRAQQRALENEYVQIAPEAIKQVTQDLSAYFQENDRHYIQKAIKRLHEQSQRADKA